MKYSCLILILCILNLTGSGQTVSNVRLVPDGERVHVYYDLVAPPNHKCDMDVTFFSAVGKKALNATTITGDTKEVSAGRDLKITWELMRDLQEGYSGLMKAEVMVVSVASPQEPADIAVDRGGGPSNALLSVLLPGLGDVFVNEPASEPLIKPAYISLLYASSAGLAIYCHNEALKYKKAAAQTTLEYEYESYIKNAEYYEDQTKWMTAIAATVWITDVIRVAVKGHSNVSKRNSMSSLRVRLNYHVGLNSAGITIHL